MDGKEQVETLKSLHEIEKQRNKLEEKVHSLEERLMKAHQAVADKLVTAGKLELAFQNLFVQVCTKLDPSFHVSNKNMHESFQLPKCCLKLF